MAKTFNCNCLDEALFSSKQQVQEPCFTSSKGLYATKSCVCFLYWWVSSPSDVLRAIYIGRDVQFALNACC